MADIAQLEQALRYHFRDPALLSLALTHPSKGPKHNQRLEFLGDAVLEMCVSEKIYAMHPEMQEGEMTRLRQKLVREEKLAEAARGIRLGDYLLMDRSCEMVSFSCGAGRRRGTIQSRYLLSIWTRRDKVNTRSHAVVAQGCGARVCRCAEQYGSMSV